MESENRPGVLIALEGIDGTGKSTQLNLLAGYLRNAGYEVVATREPTDGPAGKRIRASFSSRHLLTPQEELSLFMEDRRQHVRECILPALHRGAVVVTDRYYLSTAAYQGARGLDPVRIVRENERFAPAPDLAIILELSPEEGIRRIKGLRGDIPNDFEAMDTLVRAAEIFASFSYPWVRRVDASRGVEEVHRDIVRCVEEIVGPRSVMMTAATGREQGGS